MPVYRRRDGRRNPFFYKFDLNRQTYKQGGFTSRGQAEDAEAAARLQARQESTGTGFSQAVGARLDYVKAYCTAQTYRQNVTRLMRFWDWEKLALATITPEMVRSRMVDLSKVMSPSLANKHLIALRSVFEQALNDGLLVRNPCRGLKFLPVARQAVYVPGAGEIEEVLSRAQELDRAYLTVIWQLAARVREVNSLTWDDVDFQRRQVRLWTRKKRGGNKTARLVPMNDRTFQALKLAQWRRRPGSPYVFTNPVMAGCHPKDPDRWKYDYRAKFFDGLCRQAGVREMGYHALRHQKASALADEGQSLTYIQDFLGHENALTTAIYLHSLGIQK